MSPVSHVKCHLANKTTNTMRLNISKLSDEFEPLDGVKPTNTPSSKTEKSTQQATTENDNNSTTSHNVLPKGNSLLSMSSLTSQQVKKKKPKKKNTVPDSIKQEQANILLNQLSNKGFVTKKEVKKFTNETNTEKLSQYKQQIDDE
jgi:hypothetical protein